MDEEAQLGKNLVKYQHNHLQNHPILLLFCISLLVLPLIAAPTPLSAYPSSSTATSFSSSTCRPSSATSAAFACSCCISTSSTSSPFAHVVFNNLDSERRLLQRPAEDGHDQTSTHRLRSCHRRHSRSLRHHQRLHRHLRSSHPLPWAQTTAANPKSPNHRHPSRKKSNASSSFISGTVSYWYAASICEKSIDVSLEASCSIFPNSNPRFFLLSSVSMGICASSGPDKTEMRWKTTQLSMTA